MNIAVIGTGYVGLTAGAGLASKGHKVTCVDIDKEKVEKINNGKCPIYEENLPELIEEVVSNKSLKSTSDTISAVENADIVMLAVGTPADKEGNINLEYIKQAAKDITKGMKQRTRYQTIVVKSTVVPGTTEELIEVLEDSGKTAGQDFGVCMNPEFLREGTALDDFLNPDRIVIGELNQKSGDVIEKMYSKFDAPVMRTGLKEAELIKYASNSLLATKISFINEIGNLCKKLDIDVYEVAEGVGLDSRINREFLDSGAGFGGSCFPKDVRALIKFMEEKGETPRILESTIQVNQKQKTLLVKQLQKHLSSLEGRTIAILGLAFKPGTDDIRNSPAIDIITELKNKDAKVKAYDPQANENMKQKHPNIQYTSNYQEALKDSDAALLVTDWPEFNQIKRKDLKQMKQPLLLEGRKTKNNINTKGISWP